MKDLNVIVMDASGVPVLGAVDLLTATQLLAEWYAANPADAVPDGYLRIELVATMAMQLVDTYLVNEVVVRTHNVWLASPAVEGDKVQQLWTIHEFAAG